MLSIRTIQRVYRGARSRKVTDKLLGAGRAAVWRKKADAAATIIQCMCRKCVTRAGGLGIDVSGSG